MGNQKMKKLENKIRKIEMRLLTVGAMLEVVRDSCLYNDCANQELALEVVLKKFYQITEEVSLLF